MFQLASVLLVLLLTYQLVAPAKVAPTIITGQEDLSSCVDYRSQRTLFNIIWGCVSTTIICAWAAIHPNIPPREGPFKKTLRRLELMFWTIVAPEILPCWALNQLLAAITVRDVYNKRKGDEMKSLKGPGIWKKLKGWFSLCEIKEVVSPAWTVAHGHFIIMGGFHIVELPDGGLTKGNMDKKRATFVEETNVTGKGHGPSEPEPELEQGTILNLEMLEELIKNPEFEIRITEEEITNRSKGDVLSKLIFMLQSTWFILQCIGRRVQGLDLTQLELTTLALASLNGITFVLWWDKPLGAQTTVRVYLKRKLTDSERVPLPPVEGEITNRSMRSKVIPSTQSFFVGCVATIHDAFRCKPEGLILLPFAIIFLFLSPIIAFAFAFFATLIDLVLGTSTYFSTDDTHVPTFYVSKHRYSKWYHVLLLITLGVIFGGIHCSGWDSSFSTYAEQKLWRTASVAVTIIPIAAFPFALIINTLVRCRLPTFEAIFDDTPGILLFFLCTLAYVSARLVLLVLALAQLRHLPSTAFIAVDWATFFPHIL